MQLFRGFNEIHQVNLSKAMFSDLRKKDGKSLKLNFINNKNGFRQTVTGFNHKQEREKPEGKFYETSVNGFNFANRTLGKERPGDNKSKIKQSDKEI